jgi:hypothetical protein
VNWHSWSAAPFLAAADSGRPILLFLTTAWSRGCAEMERATFADPFVASLADREFVAVRVDADLRPDVAERYALSGWPSTLLLTDQGDILQGATFLDAPGLADLLERTVERYRTERDEISRRALDARAHRADSMWNARSSGGAFHPSATGEIAEFLLVKTDPSGGFDGAPKFLHGDALLFFLRHGDPRCMEAARRSLDAGTRMLSGPDGEAYRCALGADWAEPVPEVTPESQATAIRLFADAFVRLDERYAEPLRRAVRFAERTWLSPSGPPLPTDSGADLAGACLAAARHLDEAPLGHAALALLERVSLATYRPGGGVRHSDASDAPFMLSDHLALIAALFGAEEATGQVPYLMLAEELGHRVLEAFFDERAEALRDRVHDGDDRGRLSEPLYPYRLNARGAGLLARLAKASGEPRFASAATRLLDRVAPHWRGQGLDAAACGIAWLDLIDWRHS